MNGNGSRLRHMQAPPTGPMLLSGNAHSSSGRAGTLVQSYVDYDHEEVSSSLLTLEREVKRHHPLSKPFTPKFLEGKGQTQPSLQKKLKPRSACRVSWWCLCDFSKLSVLSLWLCTYSRRILRP